MAFNSMAFLFGLLPVTLLCYYLPFSSKPMNLTQV